MKDLEKYDIFAAALDFSDLSDILKLTLLLILNELNVLIFF